MELDGMQKWAATCKCTACPLPEAIDIVEPFNAHYVIALGIARFSSCAHWVLQHELVSPPLKTKWDLMEFRSELQPASVLSALYRRRSMNFVIILSISGSCFCTTLTAGHAEHMYNFLTTGSTSSSNIVEPFIAHYVTALGVARFMSCSHWVLQICICL
ncbi:uncharacterized protein LOC131605269 [Vicia villosa]|uniref:uncharacterized protein LOC131605269 n=1 Tax=Vicia villosa TaxID=3911 RepID=UPI00273CEC28|nr:uncharacterized protein LOC131605269 [Vicia villosa]